AMPGVERILTARDVPGVRWQGLIYKDWPVFIAEGELTRCEGDVLAAVIADTAANARRAAEAIRVEYEVLEPIDDPIEAAKPTSPLVHPDKHPDGNVLSISRVKRGSAEIEAILEGCTHTEHEVFECQRIEHLFLEPESALAIPAKWFEEHDCGGHFEGPAGPPVRVHVLSQGQGVFDDREQIASLLGLGLDEVQVELISNGGAFGVKEDMTIQGHAALAAMLLGKPVKFTLTRMESVRMHPKRHPMRLEYWVGADASGNLQAVKARIIGDTGA
ncbi:molybdopterin-dependent oxidoreductase, partial [Candidatus Poribacteria bacterium]|nr:molybdopterin-dependent oxidoreductase [Candidatus Poribacteria bacterium]